MAATKTAKKSASARTSNSGLTAEEKAAMRETIKERRANATKEEDESALLAKIAAMAEPDRSMAKKVHAIVRANAPELSPKLWYGMPAYYKDGKPICFFQDAAKFKARYATFGFNDGARIDDGAMWPIAFALTKLTATDEAKIGALVKKSVR